MVRCKDCGYVCRLNRNSNEMIQIDRYFRENGKMRAPSHEGQFVTGVFCFLGVQDLQAESRHSSERSENEQFAVNLQVLDNNRECERFRQFIEGLGPKETMNIENYERSLAFTKQMFESYSAHEYARLSELRSDFRETFREMRNDWEASAKKQATQFKVNLFFTFLIAIVAAFAGAFASKMLSESTMSVEIPNGVVVKDAENPKVAKSSE